MKHSIKLASLVILAGASCAPTPAYKGPGIQNILDYSRAIDHDLTPRELQGHLKNADSNQDYRISKSEARHYILQAVDARKNGLNSPND